MRQIEITRFIEDEDLSDQEGRLIEIVYGRNKAIKDLETSTAGKIIQKEEVILLILKKGERYFKIEKIRGSWYIAVVGDDTYHPMNTISFKGE